jgi:hypothetical protein
MRPVALGSRALVGLLAVASFLLVAPVASSQRVASTAEHAATRTCTGTDGLMVEGDAGPLSFRVTGIACAKAVRVVKEVIYSGGPCKGANLTGPGCHASLGFLCRIPHPESPGYASPGDTADCTSGRKRIQVQLPG